MTGRRVSSAQLVAITGLVGGGDGGEGERGQRRVKNKIQKKCGYSVVGIEPRPCCRTCFFSKAWTNIYATTMEPKVTVLEGMVIAPGVFITRPRVGL